MQRLCHRWSLVNWCVCLVCALMLNSLEPVLLWEWEGIRFLTQKHTQSLTARLTPSSVWNRTLRGQKGGGHHFSDCDWRVEGVKGCAFKCSGRVFLAVSSSQPVLSLQLLTLKLSLCLGEKENHRVEVCVCVFVCVCAVYVRVNARKRKTCKEGVGICQDKGGIISLTRGKHRCEKTLFYSTNLFRATLWRESMPLVVRTGGKKEEP